MNIESFIEGPLLWIALLLLISVITVRLVFFFTTIIKSSQDKNSRIVYNLKTFGRFLAPFHMGIMKHPFYCTLRYVFHACLFIVPIWLSGHIALWYESRFEWEWVAIPDEWADRMTITLLALALYFIIRRIFIKELRLNSSIKDHLIILLVALPFLTGYFLTHGTLDEMAFLGSNMMIIHILTGEIMMITAAFLFIHAWLNPRKCTGCAACEESCPTGSIESKDNDVLRTFSGSHYQCIACASCIYTCPEAAVELRHEISFKKFLQIFSKNEIRTVKLRECENCSSPFSPEPLMEKIEGTFKNDYITLCPKCRRYYPGRFFS